MRNTLLLLLLSSTLLASGCATVRDSRVNPFNWFGSDDDIARIPSPELAEETNPLIPQSQGLFNRSSDTVIYGGTPVASLTDLTLERVPGGLLIRATGRSTPQAYLAQLTPASGEETPDDDGVLTYRLEALDAAPSPGVPQNQQIIVARTLTDQELGATRVIRVESASNALQARRR